MKKLLYALRAVRQRGIGFLWTYFRQSVLFDLRHGTQTASRVPKSDQTLSQGSEAENGLLYVASFTSVTVETVAHARELLGRDRFAGAQFFDIGCGKGKALLVFARTYGSEVTLPATGIEYDPDLARIARANVAKCAFATGRVEVAADSALNIRDYVKSDTLIIYLYNSFQGETLRAFLDLLRGKAHVLIYVDPAERSVLPDYGYTIVRDRKGAYNADTWLIATSGLV